MKDELIGEILEVEFISNSKQLRARPTRWSRSVWCMRAAGEKFGVLIIINLSLSSFPVIYDKWFHFPQKLEFALQVLPLFNIVIIYLICKSKVV